MQIVADNLQTARTALGRALEPPDPRPFQERGRANLPMMAAAGMSMAMTTVSHTRSVRLADTCRRMLAPEPFAGRAGE